MLMTSASKSGGLGLVLAGAGPDSRSRRGAEAGLVADLAVGQCFLQFGDTCVGDPEPDSGGNTASSGATQLKA